MIGVAELSEIFKAPAQGNTTLLPLQRWLTDSREPVDPAGAVFFALKGDNHDGHDYLPELYQRGVRAFVVQEDVETRAFPNAAWWRVPNTLHALQDLATYWRQQFEYPVVAITGSNGKTIVKEWLSQLAGSTFSVVKSPKSYNSQVGVPLSLRQMRPHHSLGIFEAGISQAGEMERLTRMLKPNYGIFTNLGTAHDEGFSSRHAKLAEKAGLFQQCEKVVYRADQEAVARHFETALPADRQWAWSFEDKAPIRVRVENNQLSIQWNGQSFSFQVPFQDRVSLENLTHCLVLLLGMGVSAPTLQSGLALLRPPGMRLSLKDGINDSAIIDDTYNNDLAGLEVALSFMDRQPPRSRKTVMLSDMEETGQTPNEVMRTIESVLVANGISRWLGVGPDHVHYQPQHIAEYYPYPSTEALLKDVAQHAPDHELILIKGARSYGFERVVSALQQKVHGTTLEVNLEALTHNLNVYRRQLQPGVKLMVMVKAMAYGSGSEEVAHLLQFHRVDYLAVAYVDEGVQLRQRGITTPIMVMNPSPESFYKLLEWDLEPELYSFRLLHSYGMFLQRQQKSSRVHIKVDTGMRRLGFDAKEIPQLIADLHAYPQLRPVSVFSHLAGADEASHNSFSHRQADTFMAAATQLEKAGYSVTKHLLNSPGILRFPEYQFDMVRLGIGLYGVEAAGISPDSLQPVSRLVTTVSQVRDIPAGETIGYGRQGHTQRPTRVATLAIGYADGYDRGFSRGVGEVLIRGQRAPVLGNVCMDMTMVDATGIPVEEGDEAVVFGPELPLPELAEKIETIPYELLTNVSTRVRRVYYTG